MAAFVFVKFVVTFDLFGVHDGERMKPVEFNPAGVDIAAKRAQLDTDITTWIDAFNDNNAFTGEYVSNAFIPSYTIAEKYAWDDPAPSFSGGENVYQEAQLQSVLDSKGEKYSTYIPAPDAQIFVGNSLNTKVIDIADPAYTTYGALYTTAGICQLSDGDAFEDPLNVTAAALRTVRSGKSY
jgi:hypothetical protein